MHVLPQLRELESRYPNQIAVVGVHSGKYTTERDLARIRDASIRLDAAHPIVNDRQFRLWRAYAVRAWPTLVAIDPAGAVVGMQAGEFTADAISPFIDRVLTLAREAGTLAEAPLHFEMDPPTSTPGTLAYPGKVAVEGSRGAIADSGHHRVIIGRLSDDGARLHVERIVGDGTPGFRDGDTVRFRSPQGLAFHDDSLLVADAGNHVVRGVTISTGVTRTLAGTGNQMRTTDDLREGALSSPWDLAIVGDTLFVAMAGVHRLWAISLNDGLTRPFSGTGAEALQDGRHDQAALAQPMGLCVASDGRLAFVDAESSAVRLADTESTGDVSTVVGTGLFDFGDVDGVGDDVRMQHQQGITMLPDGRLLVCDSYNDALKIVDPSTRRAETWIRGLHEPSGIDVSATSAYVADTNAHRIVVVNLRSGEQRELVLEL